MYPTIRRTINALFEPKQDGDRLVGLCVTLCGMAGAGAVAQEMPNDYQDVLRSLDRKGILRPGFLR
jgi:hypothetical protein